MGLMVFNVTMISVICLFMIILIIDDPESYYTRHHLNKTNAATTTAPVHDLAGMDLDFYTKVEKMGSHGIALVMACTTIDYNYMLKFIINMEIPIKNIYLTFNGHNKTAWKFLSMVRRRFPDKISLYLYAENEGVSRAWNNGIVSAFAADHPHVIIANPDVTINNEDLAISLEEAIRRKCLVANFVDYALFLFSRRAYEIFGLFDENFFPAYSEDTDLQLKYISLGLQSGVGNISIRNTHVRSINLKIDKSLKLTFLPRRDYLFQKWGVPANKNIDFSKVRPFKFPFNNPKMYHNDSWIIDPKYRICLKKKLTKCRFNKDVLSEKFK